MTMTREEIADMIEGIGLPFAYYEFERDTAQEPPFIVFFYSQYTNVYADNSNYVDKEVLNIELYTRTRDFDTEATVEAVLGANGFTYNMEPSYIGSEKIWQIAYEMEVIINEPEEQD